LLWESWEEVKGLPVTTAQKLFIEEASSLLIEYGYEDMVREDPKRPGPDYYKDCIKFNWIDALVSNH
jgi:hypothetical protein